MVEGRFQILLDANYFTADYLVSPIDKEKYPVASTTLTTDNYSYSLLQIPDEGGRRVAWVATGNFEIPAWFNAAQGNNVWAARLNIEIHKLM